MKPKDKKEGRKKTQKNPAEKMRLNGRFEVRPHVDL